ncbi:ClpX C4-type zinc finger protein [Planotetraspora sp. A-T 1434]|uniref:ClpX C4-type zinc finger protein n=1 Tax=Planotetraspora sp. A-T 1434 TaxID=2979219 RepID=UPI0021BE1936|nr:ClpX C4-type zinc finger protein [Planotetraspora sp. A-T 1434]MCT9929718.1 ClpX C4-type zinc finger protein [Planotetraspora sp. A-T 1434]
MDQADLLERARRRSSDPTDPLEILTAAIALSAELSSEADTLLDQAVRDAREAGASWNVIGERFGFSKQAARKRFTPPFAGRHLANRRKKRDASCSFCRTPPSPRVRMVHGEGGRICDKCVALAGEIVADLAKRR